MIEHIFPIGNCCLVAHLIDQAGMRQFSYPFDWIWASPRLVNDAIKDGFQNLLDPAKIIEHQSGGYRSGHADYGAGTFNHHDLRVQKEWDKFRRRADRFMEAIQTKEEKLFVHYGEEPNFDWFGFSLLEDTLLNAVHPPFRKLLVLRSSMDSACEAGNLRTVWFKAEQCTGLGFGEEDDKRFIALLKEYPVREASGLGLFQ